MSIYTNIGKLELDQILLTYGIVAERFTPLQGGNANSSYQLEVGDADFILTLMEEKSMPEAEVLGELLLRLNEHQFPTNRVIPTGGDGALISAFGRNPVLLKERATGEVHADLSADMLRQIGRTMANLHQIPPPENLPQAHPYELSIFPKVVGLGKDLKYESWLDERLEHFNNHLPEALPRGLIHGDLFFDNVLFENGNLTAVIDFEEACNHFLIYDLGMAALGLCSAGEEIDPVKICALTEGYQQVSPLDSISKSSLPLFIEYAAVGTSCWRFWKYHIESPTLERQAKHLEMVRLAESAKQLDAADCFGGAI